VTAADAITASSTTFLRTALPLTLCADKPLIPPAPIGKARGLGDDIGMMHSPDQCDHPRRRVVKGQGGLDRPEDVRQTKRTRALRAAKPRQRPALRNDSAYDIIGRSQGAYRGLINDYGWAHNLAPRGSLRVTMAPSLLTTRAGKHQTSVRKEAKRLPGTAQTPEGPRTCLHLTIPRAGKRPLGATCGGLARQRVKPPVIKDQVLTPYPRMRSEIIAR
jgi:hypothetical protein